MVGNYGVPDPSRVDEYGLARGFESGRIQASALIVQDYSRDYSHWNAQTSLGEWMAQEVGFWGVAALATVVNVLARLNILQASTMPTDATSAANRASRALLASTHAC